MKNILTKYSYEIKIISIYTICLAIVYGSLVYVLTRSIDTPLRIGFSILTFILIVIVGLVVGIIYIKHKEKTKNNNEEVKE